MNGIKRHPPGYSNESMLELCDVEDFNAQDYVNYKYNIVVNNPRLTALQYAVM
jgi:hypothetical protein